MANFEISQYPFSPERIRELESVYNEVDWAQFIKEPLRRIDLGADLLHRLVVDAKNHPVPQDSERALSLKLVADFLVCIATCGKRDLARTVEKGLRSLDIERPSPGRPKGRKSDTLYFEYVKALQGAIEETCVFSKKAEMKRSGRGWTVRFRRFLEREKWPIDKIDLLITSRTPQVLAFHIASEKFDCSYDRIYRACLSAAKTGQK